MDGGYRPPSNPTTPLSHEGSHGSYLVNAFQSWRHGESVGGDVISSRVYWCWPGPVGLAVPNEHGQGRRAPRHCLPLPLPPTHQMLYTPAQSARHCRPHHTTTRPCRSRHPPVTLCCPAPFLALVTRICRCCQLELSFSPSILSLVLGDPVPLALPVCLIATLPPPSARAHACLHTPTYVFTAIREPKPARVSSRRTLEYTFATLKGEGVGLQNAAASRQTRPHRRRQQRALEQERPFLDSPPSIPPARSREDEDPAICVPATHHNLLSLGLCSHTLGGGYCSRAAASTAPLSFPRPVCLPVARDSSSSCCLLLRACLATTSQHSVSVVLPRVVPCVAAQACCRRRQRCCYCRGRYCCHGRCHDDCGCGCNGYHVEATCTTHDDGTHPSRARNHAHCSCNWVACHNASKLEEQASSAVLSTWLSPSLLRDLSPRYATLRPRPRDRRVLSIVPIQCQTRPTRRWAMATHIDNPRL